MHDDERRSSPGPPHVSNYAKLLNVESVVTRSHFYELNSPQRFQSQEE